MTRWIAAVAAMFALGWTVPGQPPAEPRDPQSAVEPRSAPGEGQKFLSRFVGRWNVEKTFIPRQGSPVQTSGICTQEMIHGGRFLRSEFTFQGPSGPTTGTGVIGFDPATGLFTSVWFDSRSTRLSHRVSRDKFDGRQIVLFAAGLDGAQSRPSRTVTTLEDDGARIVHVQYTPDGEGKERVMMKLVLTKLPVNPAGGK
jgi:hypothetical protein